MPPDVLDGFPDAQVVKPKTGRRRWADSDGKIYEWDYMHGTVERYSGIGVHEGEFDPRDGRRLNGPVKGRRTEP